MHTGMRASTRQELAAWNRLLGATVFRIGIMSALVGTFARSSASLATRRKAARTPRPPLLATVDSPSLFAREVANPRWQAFVSLRSSAMLIVALVINAKIHCMQGR
eukprot:8840220-Pyramimonas_sp.AAC.1